MAGKEMRNFILGIIAAFLLLGLGGLAIAGFGFMPTNADSSPPAVEKHIATSALHAAMNRHAPRLSNPVPASDENLIAGMKSTRSTAPFVMARSIICRALWNIHFIRLFRNSFWIQPITLSGILIMWFVMVFATRACLLGATH